VRRGRIGDPEFFKSSLSLTVRSGNGLQARLERLVFDAARFGATT
jgi:hypothetical protein